MSQFVLQDMVNKLGIAEMFSIDSRATSREEIGNPPHRGTVKKMQEVGIPVIPHRATQITWSDYSNADYVIFINTRIPFLTIYSSCDFSENPHCYLYYIIMDNDGVFQGEVLISAQLKL